MSNYNYNYFSEIASGQNIQFRKLGCRIWDLSKKALSPFGPILEGLTSTPKTRSTPQLKPHPDGQRMQRTLQRSSSRDFRAFRSFSSFIISLR